MKQKSSSTTSCRNVEVRTGAPGEKRERVSISFIDEYGEPIVGMTEQHHKEACDVNNIISQYDRTGLLTHVNNTTAKYGDFTQVQTYQDSMNLLIQAQESFLELPSDIRRRFNNDPGAFIEFVTNPKNQEKIYELGLAEKPLVDMAAERAADSSPEEPQE